MPARPAVPVLSAPTPDRTLAELVDLVRSVARRPEVWTPHLPPPSAAGEAAPRHWARLPAPPHVDLWLLTWLPDQATDLHDHGAAAAAFTVVQGEVEEVRERYGPAGPGLGRHRLRTGDTRWMAPGVRHDVRHAGVGPAASLHAYSPRLTRMTFWEPTRTGLRAVRTVRTDAPEQETP